MEVQVFGVKDHRGTRAALRFFAERRVTVHFSDLDVRAPAPRELERFARAVGVEGLIDRQSRRFAELGLGAARYTGDQWMTRLMAEPRLLRLPLVRQGEAVTVGVDEPAWKSWYAARRP